MGVYILYILPIKPYYTAFIQAAKIEMKKRSQLKGLLLLSPMLILIGLFLVYPFANVIRLSFFKTQFGFGKMEYYGFKNFITVFSDKVFLESVKNSFYWTFGSLILQLSLPLAIALLLNRKFRGENIVKSIILIPWITPVVGISMLVRWMLEPQLGVINRILLNIGFIQERINLLGSMTGALPTLIIVSSWMFIPFGTLLILASLSTILPELYDAMKIDGADYWQTFKHLVFPLVGSMIGFVFFFGFVWNFNAFALIWLITRGGPVNSTMTLPVLIYQKAFASFNMGEASAIATVMGVFLIIIGFIFFKYLWKKIET